jgi:hypothetical protein
MKPPTPREAAVRRYCDESGARYNENDFDDAGNLLTWSVDALDQLDNAKLAAQFNNICEAAYHDGRCEDGRILEEVIGRLCTVGNFNIGDIVRVPPGYGSGELAVVVGPATESVCVRLGDGRLCNLDLDEVTADEDLEDET